MTPTELAARLAGLIRERYGLDASRGNMSAALERFAVERLEALGPALDPAGYLDRVRRDESECARLIHAATVKLSWFFREAQQLDELVAFLAECHRRERRRTNVWIAGCASGEEAWTVAMQAAERAVPVRVLATDIDALALAKARSGRYEAWSARELPVGMARYLRADAGGVLCIDELLRGSPQGLVQVEFAEHNLCAAPPEPGVWDAICCRNVLIYFEHERARQVAACLRTAVRPEGRVFFGASDLLFQPCAGEAGSTRSPDVQACLAAARPLPVSIGRPTTPVALDTDALLTRAAAACEAGELEIATDMLARVVARDPSSAEAHLWMGIAHYSAGSFVAADRAFRRARCLSPELWPATLFAALTSERRGRQSVARRCWAELRRIIDQPDAPAIEGSAALLDALSRWRSEALALAYQRAPDR